MAYGPSTGLSAGGVGRGTGAPPVRPPLRAAPLVRPKVVPLTDEQVAAQQVKAAFDPILNNLTNQYNARGEAQAQAITGSTDELARLMGSYGPTAASAYDRAASNDAAINSVLAATRQGQGADASAALAGKLGGIDNATTARVNGGLTGDLAGESLASATKGANNLAMLLGQGASAADYGAKLPGIAGGIGLNANRTAQGQITNELSTQLQSLAAQEPKAVQDALAAIQTNKAKNAQLAFENSLKNAEFGLSSQKAKTAAAQGNARLTIAQQNANTAAARANTAAAQGWARIGITQQRVQQQEAAATARRKAAGLTPGEVATIRAKAEHDAETMYYGVAAKTRADGSVVTPAVAASPYGQAYKTLLARYPSLGPKAAIAILNTLYAPGEGGRPAGKGLHFVNGNPVFGK